MAGSPARSRTCPSRAGGVRRCTAYSVPVPASCPRAPSPATSHCCAARSTRTSRSRHDRAQRGHRQAQPAHRSGRHRAKRRVGMTAVFSHGRLRLYLLKLLAEGPKHGYELIRLLENRFLGLYAPSAGTIYPRLARLEAEGLVSHAAAGGRKVYEITDGGRAELAHRAGELGELEREIHASLADLTTLATEIEQQVSGSVRDIKRELREAARQSRAGSRPPGGGPGPGATPAAGQPGPALRQ